MHPYELFRRHSVKVLCGTLPSEHKSYAAAALLIIATALLVGWVVYYMYIDMFVTRRGSAVVLVNWQAESPCILAWWGYRNCLLSSRLNCLHWVANKELILQKRGGKKMMCRHEEPDARHMSCFPYNVVCKRTMAYGKVTKRGHKRRKSRHLLARPTPCALHKRQCSRPTPVHIHSYRNCFLRFFFVILLWYAASPRCECKKLRIRDGIKQFALMRLMYFSYNKQCANFL